jgi:hypothetical protein
VAKDNRKILRGIRTTQASPTSKPDSHGVVHKLKNVVFSEGMEDELAAQFNNTQLKAMVERGDLSGDWKSTKK